MLKYIIHKQKRRMSNIKKSPYTLKMILNRLSKFWYLVILSFILSLIIVFFTLLIPILIGNAIDLIIDKNNVDFVKLTSYFMYMVISIIITSIAQWFLSIVNNQIIYKLSFDIRNEAINKIQKLPLSKYDNGSF